MPDLLDWIALMLMVALGCIAVVRVRRQKIEAYRKKMSAPAPAPGESASEPSAVDGWAAVAADEHPDPEPVEEPVEEPARLFCPFVSGVAGTGGGYGGSVYTRWVECIGNACAAYAPDAGNPANCLRMRPLG